MGIQQDRYVAWGVENCYMSRIKESSAMLSNSVDNLRLCHSVPGRLRLQSKVLRQSAIVHRDLEISLSQIDHVQKAEVRKTTGSLIIVYDSNSKGPEKIIEEVNRILQSENNHAANLIEKDQPIHAKQPYEQQNRRDSRALVGHLVNAVALTAFVAYVLVRKIFFRSPLSQKPFSVTGIVATVGALPLLKRAWWDLKQGRRLGLFPFLAGSCGLAIASGEAFTALEIIWILAIGMLLEEYAAERARRAIREIFVVAPEETLILVEDVEVMTAVAEVIPGDTVVVRLGDRIPADGVVLKGEALVDEAHITGRSQPELRKVEDLVYAGTKVLQGTLYIRADKLGDDTYLSRITRLVEESLVQRAEAEKRADVLAVRLMRYGIAATLTTFILTRSIARSFSVLLVVSCPCATVLAASTAVTAAIANAARRQILVKGGLYLERINTINYVCFDKTGTITSGVPQVVEVIARAPRQDASRILAMAASAEAKSVHPMAKALIQAARDRDLILAKKVSAEEFLGRGVRATVNGDLILAGNERFLRSEGVDPSYLKSKARQKMASGHTVIYVAKNGTLQGLIALANTVRPGASAVVDWLRKDGVGQISLISGDEEPIVRSVSQSLQLDYYKANMLPEDKADYLEGLEESNSRVLMVGDGVNDALALAKASVGVAMGAGGSEVAVEASDIALVTDDLKGLVFIRMLSSQTLSAIEQNFWLATTTNISGILLGALGWLTPVMAGLLHVGHTFGIMVNSSRLLRWEPDLDLDSANK
jgi:cation-transporting P-type ATPase C